MSESSSEIQHFGEVTQKRRADKICEGLLDKQMASLCRLAHGAIPSAHGAARLRRLSERAEVTQDTGEAKSGEATKAEK